MEEEGKREREYTFMAPPSLCRPRSKKKRIRKGGEKGKEDLPVSFFSITILILGGRKDSKGGGRGWGGKGEKGGIHPSPFLINRSQEGRKAQEGGGGEGGGGKGGGGFCVYWSAASLWRIRC